MRIRSVAVHACAFLLTFASVTALADAPARPYRYGTVWVIGSFRMKPGMQMRYKDHVATKWKESQEAQKKAGLILSYRAFVAEDTYGANDWNIILMKEYKDMATLQASQDKVDEIAVKVDGSQKDFEDGYRERELDREILDQKITYEMVFSPSE